MGFFVAILTQLSQKPGVRPDQIRPDGDGPTGDFAEAGAVGLPDLMAAITTAQAKNSRSRS